MTMLTIFLSLLIPAGASAAACPKVEGGLFCVTAGGGLLLGSAAERMVDGHNFLVIEFGQSMPGMTIPLGEAAVVVDENTTLSARCVNGRALRATLSVKSDPALIPVRELRFEGNGRFRIVDSFEGTSPLASQPPRLVATCDPVLR